MIIKNEDKFLHLVEKVYDWNNLCNYEVIENREEFLIDELINDEDESYKVYNLDESDARKIIYKFLYWGKNE